MTHIIYLIQNVSQIDLFNTVLNISTLGWTKVELQLQATTLQSIPTQGHHGLSGGSYDKVERRG